MTEHTDIKLKSWGNGSSSGPWVKIDLLDEDDLEFFKSQMGNGFHMVLVPIDCGEEGEPVEEPVIVGPAKKRELTLSQQAHMMINTESFMGYLNHYTGKNYFTYKEKDDWLKKTLSIDSKSKLDSDMCKLEQESFCNIRDGWRDYVNSAAVPERV